MYCPQCGQQQVPGAVRFCSRCGFPLDGVLHLLSTGGILPVYREPDGPKQISPRKKGMKQGGILLLSGAIICPILAVFASYIPSRFPEILAAFAAIICFIGGPLRMLYAAIFEEGAPRPMFPGARPYIPSPMGAPQFGPAGHNTALPPPPPQTASAWRSRPITAELANPPSVTENTTRLLDKEDRSGNQ
jgi:hypothetical protein